MMPNANTKSLGQARRETEKTALCSTAEKHGDHHPGCADQVSVDAICRSISGYDLLCPA